MPTSIVVGSASELQTALANASGGETIVLRTGDYGSLSVSNRAYAAPVKVISQDGNDGARFTGINLNNVENLSFDEVTIHTDQTLQYWVDMVSVTSSRGISITNSEFFGSLDGVSSNDGTGAQFSNSRGIVFSNNDLHDVARGAGFFGVTDLVAEGNSFTDLRTTPIQATVLNNAIFKDNFFQGSKFLPGDHMDFIHIWANDKTPVSHHVTLSGNVMLQGNGQPSPAFFVENDRVAQGDYHTDFVIEGNLLYHGHVNSILVQGIDGGEIKNNSSIAIGGPNYLWDPRILVNESKNLEIAYNVAGNAPSSKPAAGIVAHDNIAAQHTDPTDANYYGDLFANPFANAAATVEDLAPRPGSVLVGGSTTIGALSADGRLLLADGGAPSRTPTPDPHPITDPDPVTDPDPTPTPVPGPPPQNSEVPPPLFHQDTATFDGSTRSAKVLPHDASYELAAGTLVIDFVADSLGGRQQLLSKDAYGFVDGGHLSVSIEGNDIAVRLQSAMADHKILARDAVTAGQAEQLALSFGPEGMKLYLDGSLVGSNDHTGGLTGNREPLVIGANEWASTSGTADKLLHPFAGQILGVDLYGEALDADTIAGLGSEPARARVAGSAGDDQLRGDAGPDTFVFAPGGGDDTVQDFVAGEDLLAFAFRGGPDDLLVSQGTDGAEISSAALPGTSVTLVGVAASDLADGDFLFM